MEIKILHLFYDLMNLYGEYGNIKSLKKCLEQENAEVIIDCLSLENDIDFTKYDFIYIGSGTENNQKIALNYLLNYRDELVKAYNSGVVILATGNAFEMFGKTITDCKNTIHKALGLFDFYTVETDKKRTLTDQLCTTSLFEGYLVGFINKASEIFDVTNELFSAELGTGNNGKALKEGYVSNNFYGTHLTGPCLVKNPNFMEYIVKIILKNKGMKFNDLKLHYERKAYEVTVRELLIRAENKA